MCILINPPGESKLMFGNCCLRVSCPVTSSRVVWAWDRGKEEGEERCTCESKHSTLDSSGAVLSFCATYHISD